VSKIRPHFIYISGPYSSPDPLKVAANIERADEATRALAAKGHYPFSPISQSAGWENDSRFCYEDFMRIDLAWVGKCEWFLFLGHSPGADRELAEAKERGLVVFESVDEVPAVG
jgi:hypothetical protein